jgi:hypothetical protein
VLILSGFGGLAVAYLAVRDFNLFAAVLGPLFVVIGVAGGVLKKASYSDGKWTIETHQSPFSGWTGSKAGKS